MTSTADDIVDETLSTFILAASRPRRQPNMNKFRAAAVDRGLNWTEVRLTLSGSLSEFYINPILPCVGDIDKMIVCDDVIIVTSLDNVPRRLPIEFTRRGVVSVCQIDEGEFPGYVKLEKVGDLIVKPTDQTVEDVDDFMKEYTFRHVTVKVRFHRRG